MNPSDELIQMIDRMVLTYKQTTEERDRLVRAIIDQGRSEGLEDMQIRGLIETSLKKHGLSDSSIRRALPQELKHIQMIREQRPRQIQQEPRQVQVQEPIPIPTVFKHAISTPIPLATEENRAYQVPAITETPQQKRQPDWKIVKDGTVPDAFRQISDYMKQFNYRTDKCKMALLIFYE